MARQRQDTPDAEARSRQPARRASADPSGTLRQITDALMSVRVRAIALPADGLIAELQLAHELIADDEDQAIGYESALPVAHPLGLLVLDANRHTRMDIQAWLQWLRPAGCNLAVLYATDLEADTLDRLMQSALQVVTRGAARSPP